MRALNGSLRRGWAAGLWAALCLLTTLAAPAYAATPDSATLTPKVKETSFSGAVTGGVPIGSGELCFGANKKPDAGSGCDFFKLDVVVPSGYYRTNAGALQARLDGFGIFDVDLYVYRRNTDGTFGKEEGFDGQLPGIPELVTIDQPSGSYYVVAVPYLALGRTTYNGHLELGSKPLPNPATVLRRSPPGFTNQRASHDSYKAHSEVTIAMDPVDHDHLIASSKMFEVPAKYLFKIGTYESFNGGRQWKDLGFLPGYCQEAGQCDPSDESRYRTTSDPTVAFDDEGNAYENVLDAPGGTFAFHGFNMTVHIKPRGKAWSGPITVHSNRDNPITDQLFLDDKNWIAVDNATDVNGGPNRPGDGKTGTMYICWSFDGTGVPESVPVAGGLPIPFQTIVVMRSKDGGHTWGGFNAGDNLPRPISLKPVIAGIGCQVAIGPHGEAYVTWYDNQLSALMQVKSTNRGDSWSLPYVVGQIAGVDAPFEGETFRNLSIPTSAVGPDGSVYVAVASSSGEGAAIAEGTQELARQVKEGHLDWADVLEPLRLGTREKAGESEGDQPGHERDREILAGGDGAGPGSGSDIVLFASHDGGSSWTGPVRVNQDPRNADADQFQPWMAVTPKGQINISYFDRRDDPSNFLISTYLSRSNDGGRTFFDTRVSQRPWDARIGSPTSVSGMFIGDYQGLVADDDVAIPFWNDTQLATNLKKGQAGYSPYQEAFSARVPNTPATFLDDATTTRTVRARSSRAAKLTVRGRASDPSGGVVRLVRVAVRRRSGSRCSFLDVRTRAFVKRACSKPLFFNARGTTRWSATVPLSGLRPATYAVISRAVNRSGRSETEESTGRNARKLVVRR
jgi:hypothetical protein